MLGVTLTCDLNQDEDEDMTDLGPSSQPELQGIQLLNDDVTPPFVSPRSSVYIDSSAKDASRTKITRSVHTY
jgi:hypothetical protein